MTLPEILGIYPSVDSWLQISPEGKVNVFTGKVEIGQRITTALALIVSDQLQINIDRVTITSGNTELTPDEGYTAASFSMEASAAALSLVAAEAQNTLLERAAGRLSCSLEELTVDDGTIVCGKSQETVTYWDLLGGMRFDRTVSGNVIPRRSAAPRNGLGRTQSIYSRAIVTGELKYIQDIELPGMVHGRVVRPPNYHAKLTSVDLKTVRNSDGVLEVI